MPLVRAPTYSATKAALHSYTRSLRAALKGRVEVIEWAPPAVRTRLTPGLDEASEYQPLDTFIAESFALLTQAPTPPEIVVERARYLRDAEAEGRFDQAFDAVNGR